MLETINIISRAILLISIGIGIACAEKAFGWWFAGALFAVIFISWMAVWITFDIMAGEKDA